MTVVQYTPVGSSESIEVNLKDNESVLDGLLNAGHAIPHGCRAGVCHSCLMQSDSPSIPSAAQKGLKPTQVKSGYFLSCSCFPDAPISAHLTDPEGQNIEAKVTEKEMLTENIMRLRIKAELEYEAGQFVNLWRDETVCRSYSLASAHNVDNDLEFHIKVIEEGAFSDWAKKHLNVGQTVHVQGPLGECYYCLEDKTQPILLCGIGTGLAPLYGIIKAALNQNHIGNITLIIGAKDTSNHYLFDELKTLIKEHINLNVIAVYQSGEASQAAPIITKQADIYQEVKHRFANLKGYSVYLCGAETFVKKMKKQCFLMDASLSEIHADAFISAPTHN